MFCAVAGALTGSTTCGSIMMTASHMPFQNNGLKFFVKEGGLAKKDITEVLEAAAEQCQQAGVALGECQACVCNFDLRNFDLRPC